VGHPSKDKIRLVVRRASELNEIDRTAWAALRASNPALYSPYFHLKYTELLAKLRDDVFIVCAYQDDLPIAFLPYQGERFARPVGAPMTDYHGFVCKADAEFNASEFLKEAGIGTLYFSATVNPHFEPHTQSEDEGAVMDIGDGARAWREARDSSYRRHLKSTRRRIRKSEEEFGPRRFVWKSKDRSIFNDLIRWKKQKFSETGKYDVLSAGWTMQLLEILWQSSGDLRCDMQALYFGDRLAAVDLGLTDGLTFHSWIVAYDGELHTHAPGIQLLEGLIDASGELGYSRIDLGAGTDGYKRHYASDPVKIGSGFIAAQGTAAAFCSLYGKAERFGEKALKDAPGKLRRRYTQIAACEDSISGRAKAMLSAVKTSGRG